MSKKNSNVILKNHFKDFKDFSELYKKFSNKIKKFKNKHLLIAVSGGPDSLALAALCKAYSYEKKSKFEFVLVNHNLRGNSFDEAIKVKNLLKKNDIQLKILTNKIKIKKNIQSNARTIRYDLLKKYCLKKSILTILTAHNLEDQVETFFIRLSRGSGLTGLSAMSSVTKLNAKINLFRPLLDVKKKVLIELSKTVFGRYIIDPSNKDNKFLRTKIRKLEKPLNKSGINYDQIIKSINNLASSKATLDEYFSEIFKKTVKVSKESILINLKKFKSFNSEIKMKIINLSIKNLKRNYYNPRSKKVMNLIRKIESRNFKKTTLAGCLFVKKSHGFLLKPEKK